MPRDVIPFRAGVGRSHRTAIAAPNVAFAAIELLEQLSQTLDAAVPFRDACRKHESRVHRWGVPRLFFAADREMLPRTGTRPNFIADDAVEAVARTQPRSASRWAQLTELIDDAFTVCAHHGEVRRTARAIPHLRERLDRFQNDHRSCRELSALLSVADDLVITVLHPSARTGFRFQLHGIADLDQFHILLSDAVTGSPTRGFLPGSRPDLRIVEASIDQPTDPEANIATARFQMYRPDALCTDGTLPTGFANVENWLWGHESPVAIPHVGGERLLLLADAVYPRQWIVTRRFPALRGELELLRVLGNEEVNHWMETLTQSNSEPASIRKAA